MFTVEATGVYPFEVTVPAPSIFLHQLTTVDAYGSVKEFPDAAIQTERQLVAEVIGGGSHTTTT